MQTYIGLRTIIMHKKTGFLLFFYIFFSLYMLEAAGPLPPPSWRTAIGGTIICGPEAASFGFVCIGDDRILYAFKNNGTELWHSSIEGRNPLFVTVTEDDFIYTVSDNKKITLFNSAGTNLWQITVKDNLIHPPKIGRDGRIFAVSEISVACYGINGNKKWSEKLPRKPVFPPYMLNDGSLFFILETGNIRISPYGEILNSPVLSGKITAAVETDSGIVIATADGNTISYTVKNGIMQPQWSISEQKGRTVKALCYGESLLLVIGSDNFIYAYDTISGSAEWGVFNYDIIPDNIHSVSYNNGTFNILAGTVGMGYTIYGTTQWQYSLPANIQAAGYVPGGYLVTGGTDWIIAGYKIDSPVISFTGQTKNRKYGVNFNRQFIFFPGTIRNFLTDVHRRISEGLTGKNEPEFAVSLAAIAEGKAFFPAVPTDLIERNDALYLLASLGSVEYQDVFLKILSDVSDSSVLIGAITAAAHPGFDPDGVMLDSLKKVTKRISSRQENVFLAVCDSVYAICRFMGKPVITCKGKEILLSLMSGEYGGRIYEYAAMTLEKLAKGYKNELQW